MADRIEADDVGRYRCFADIPVRFRDTDAMGHVNNAVYLTYLEVAREWYWRELFGLTDYSRVDIILARVGIDFVAPAKAGETLLAGIRTTRLGNSSFETSYLVRDARAGREIVRATSVQVCYDYAAGKPKPIPVQMRARILDFELPGSVAS